MNLRHLTIAAALGALLAGAIGIAPAVALTAPTFTVDTNTPGHVKVSVSAPDATYAMAVLSISDYPYTVVGPTVFTPTTDGKADFDFESWGVQSAAVETRACAGTSLATCGAATTRWYITPKDVVPTMTYPADDTIGPGQHYLVDVVDPDGGAALFARWGGVRTPLPPGETTEIPLSFDSSGQLVIERCSTLAPSVCRQVTGHGLTVNKELSAAVENHSLGVVSPVTGAKLRPRIDVYEGDGESYSFTWHVEDPATGSVVPGVEGTTTGLHRRDSDYVVVPVVDMTGLAGVHDYVLVGTMSYDAPDFGVISFTARFQFSVDTIAPPLPRLTMGESTTVYPYRDHYQDYVQFTVARSNSVDLSVEMEVRDSEGQTVWSSRERLSSWSEFARWGGITNSKEPAAAGTYDLLVRAVDEAGNKSAPATGVITVVRKKVVSRIFRHTYSATGTLERKFVGSCSVLRQPSRRGWAGSLGYYSNEKCARSADASVVSTIHAARLPAAMKYVGVEIAAYGGASRVSTRHIAYLNYYSRDHQWSRPNMLRPETGQHAAGYVPGYNYVFDDRYLVWGVFNVKGSHYDVKSFTVKASYEVLVPD